MCDLWAREERCAIQAASFACDGSPVLHAACSAGNPLEVTDPFEAIKDWRYIDPAFFWRITSQPENLLEPPEWYYWPETEIAGDAQPFLPTAKPRQTTIPAATLSAMEEWATSRKSNVLIVIHKGKVQLERYWNETAAYDLLNGRAIIRSVTPMAPGFAVEDGKLSLDDPIGKYMTAWKTDLRGKITARQVAQTYRVWK